MIRWRHAPGFLLLAAAALGQTSNDRPVKATGWFDDEWCTAGRVKNGQVGPSNQDCARECIRKGAKVVFIDETRKALFRVDNPQAVRGIESDYVEFAGIMNLDAGTIHVDSVKVKEKYVAKCGKPQPSRGEAH